MSRTKLDPGVRAGTAGGTYVVAASNATLAVRRRSDAVSTLANAEAAINTYALLGTVQLTDGNYVISAPIALTKVSSHLEGAGTADDMSGGGGRGFGTLIEVAADFVGSAAIIVDQVNRPAGKSMVRSLSIQGHDIGSVNGVDFRVYQGTLANLDIIHLGGHGVNVFGYVAGVPSGAVDWNTYDTNMTLLHIASCGGDGMLLGINATDLHLSTSTFHDNVGSGLHIAGGASLQATNLHSYGNHAHGIHFEGVGSRSKFANIKVEHSSLHGIFFDGSLGGMSGVQFDAVGLQCNGQGPQSLSHPVGGAGPAYDGLHSHIAFGGTGGGAGACTGIAFNNVVFGNADGVANLAKYGIDMLYSGSQTHSIQGSLLVMGSTLASCGVTTLRINYGNSAIKAQSKFTNIRGGWDWLGTVAPVPTASTGAGTSPPTPVLTGTDSSGYVTFGTGTGPSAIQQVTVTYSIARENTVAGQVQITPANAATAALLPYVLNSDSTTALFKVSTQVAPAASQAATVYAFWYHVVN